MMQEVIRSDSSKKLLELFLICFLLNQKLSCKNRFFKLIFEAQPSLFLKRFLIFCPISDFSLLFHIDVFPINRKMCTAKRQGTVKIFAIRMNWLILSLTGQRTDCL